MGLGNHPKQDQKIHKSHGKCPLEDIGGVGKRNSMLPIHQHEMNLEVGLPGLPFGHEHKGLDLCY